MGNSNSNNSDISKIHKRFGVSKQEVNEIKSLYKESCQNNRQLTRTEFRRVYNRLFPGNADDFADIMFKTFDTDRSGTVDLREFLIGLLMSDSQNVNEKIQFAFDMYDLNKNGTISRDEVREISRVSIVQVVT